MPERRRSLEIVPPKLVVYYGVDSVIVIDFQYEANTTVYAVFDVRCASTARIDSKSTSCMFEVFVVWKKVLMETENETKSTVCDTERRDIKSEFRVSRNK